MQQQEDEQTAGETVYVCKDETNNALLHETPRQKLQSLVHLSHARTCTQQSPFYLTDTREKGHGRRMRRVRLSSQMSVNTQT